MYVVAYSISDEDIAYSNMMTCGLYIITYHALRMARTKHILWWNRMEWKKTCELNWERRTFICIFYFCLLDFFFYLFVFSFHFFLFRVTFTLCEWHTLKFLHTDYASAMKQKSWYICVFVYRWYTWWIYSNQINSNRIFAFYFQFLLFRASIFFYCFLPLNNIIGCVLILKEVSRK